MNKDLLVFLPSRDEPDKLARTLDMLFSTNASQDNYDLYCAIDEDQIDLYKPVTNMEMMSILDS